MLLLLPTDGHDSLVSIQACIAAPEASSTTHPSPRNKVKACLPSLMSLVATMNHPWAPLRQVGEASVPLPARTAQSRHPPESHACQGL